MRLSSGEYLLSPWQWNDVSEISLLPHYQQGDLPNRAELHRLRVLSIALDEVELSLGTTLDPESLVCIQQQAQELRISCTCPARHDFLCSHEMLALTALIVTSHLRLFFDNDARLSFFLPHARRYGLEHEPDLDIYFRPLYDDGNVLVQPKNDSILAVDHSKPPIQLSTTVLRRPEPAALAARTRVLVFSRHRFYQQLRFELVDAAATTTGKLKAPFTFVDPAPLLWATKEANEVQFFAAISNFQRSYEEDDDASTLDALHAIIRNPKALPVYYHERELSEKINSKSLVVAGLQLLSAEIELAVFKKEPFYEIRAYLRWGEEKIAIKNLSLQHRYFLKQQDTFYLIPDVQQLHLINYFKKSPEVLLVHHSKYDDFMASTLGQLEQHIRIHYSYVRKASAAEAQAQLAERERIIYFTQEGSYINISPVMRYGTFEIPLYAKKTIMAKDDNGNRYEVERLWDEESRFQQIVAQQHPEFAAQQQERIFFYLHHQAFLDEDWFLSAFDAWRNEGISLLGFQELGLTKVNPHQAKVDIKIISGTDWFNAKINLSYGLQQVSIRQLQRAIRHKSKYVTLDDGSQGVLPLAWMDKIARYFQLAVLEADLLKIPKLRAAELEMLLDNEQLEAGVAESINAYKQQLDAVKEPYTLVPPASLEATLRPYQQLGLQWLNRLDELNLGGCLADDMGLGKTVQIIAYLLMQREKHGPCINLIVAPTSLLFNWQQELQNFAPSLRVLSLQGNARQQRYVDLAAYDVVLTSYGLLLSDVAELKKPMFNAIILDESQAIKNPNTARHRAARQLRARARFVLTGTPVENSVYDLYGQLSFACPGLLGSQQFFKDTYATPIDRFGDSKRAVTLQQTIAPFILRRTKKQVATELPSKTEMIIYCEMGEQQREIYESYETELRDYLNGQSDDDIQRNNMHVLAGLTRLRQLCNAPYLIKEGYDRRISSKMDALMEQLESISTDHKILVFSQFVEMLDLVKEQLEERQMGYSYLTGATKKRAQAVREFQGDPTRRVFLISLKAGGVGLNLTAADYVFLLEPWWNPAVENQAIDRSHRIGQDKTVIAVRMICPNTVEDKIMKLQEKKRQLATDLVRSDQTVGKNFSKQDWLAILS